ncbi:K02A2.6-like [Cordylochernes scorpioides]|uniref:RNA-directed DNA polymerase n=1 Tax=Cordylochernes scorpioides TaxID=51811 RepID=A0ABY6KQG7_9ARAC|nr:K02A2.6-like [Cordylochernes scorpioides]
MQNINPPEQFNFNNPNEWPNWIKRFERFRKASELKSKKEEEQVNALIYILGEKAEDALISFNLTEIEINNYETVVKKFEEHFIGKRNVIFERAQFNRRYQQDGEAVEEYIRVLHKMAENCNYGSLKEEMIRDRIVVGVKNLQLSEKLQLEPNLTLERAIQAACQTECVKQQQTILRSTTTQAANKWSKPEKSGCIRCGASKFHPYKDCPAKEVKCHKCKKVGHFAKVCYNKTVGQVTQGDDYHFVGNIHENGQNSNDWKAYVKVDKIKILFKMDTGADVNIIPQEIYFKNFAHKKLCKPDIQLLGPRQVKLHVIGKFTALIEKDGRSIPGEIFVVPQLMQPLLSGKACESLNLIKRLQSIEKRNLLNPFEEYPKLFTGLGTLQGSYTIKLKDESQPHAIYTPRRIPIPLLNKTKEQLDQMVEKGVIEKVEQPTDWCAPMVIVPKPSSNDLRICVDLTALNKFVKREHYPIPSVEYTLAQMGGAKLFSKLDANSGFWQIPLSEESSSLTTFLTPFGRYRFKRLPFGISSAPEVFQRKMSNLLESQSGVNCHMDDIVIWGATQEEHDERLRCVLRKLQDSGLTLNKEKCIFSVKEIKFLGHLITERGVLPDPNKVQAIREFPSPSSISEVRRFLGMVNFTGKFIPDLSTILYPLNQLLVKRYDWRWDSAQEEAFEKVKKLLSTSPALTLFDPNLPTTVSADASSYGLGAVLLQKSEDGYQKAVAYASRTMSETEKRWAQIEKESLAIVWACERFQDYLMGNTFSIETDHKPLIPIFSTKNLDEMTPRIQRLRLRMMRYSYSIYHTPGKDIVVADALSRSPIKISHEKDLENEICSFVQQITSCPPFKDENMKEIWQYQNEERVCREIKDYCEKGWPTKNELSAEAKAFWCLRYEMSVIDGLLMRNSRIYIPKSLRSKVLNSLHEGHLGIEKCRGRARSSVWWPRISQEIGELVRNCPNCIEERSNPQQPLIVSDFPSRPWEKVGIDHFYLKGKYYLLIADYYSRFPELALLEDQTTHSTILHCKSIFARHGIPEEVRSDNGPQFGLEFKKFAKEYGFHHITSSPRFPQSNGFIESMVKNIKNQLKKGRDPYLSLLGYRTAPLENGYSPAELCMNRKLRTTVPTSPVQLQSRIPDLENLEMREKDQRHKKKTHFDIHHRARELPHLNKGTRVWVKDLRVPGVVLEDAGSPRSYIVNSPKGILRRNRFHLLPNPQGEKIVMEDEEMESPEMSQCFTSTGDNTTCDSEPRIFQRSPEPVKTRSGRVSWNVQFDRSSFSALPRLGLLLHVASFVSTHCQNCPAWQFMKSTFTEFSPLLYPPFSTIQTGDPISLTLHKAIEIALALEKAAQYAKDLQSRRNPEVVKKIKQGNWRLKSSTTGKITKSENYACIRCGSDHHKQDKCPHLKAKCFNCRTEISSQIFKIINSWRTPGPIKIEVQINDKILSLEYDTGSAYSLISDSTRRFFKLPNPCPADPLRVKLTTYSGQPLQGVRARLLVDTEMKPRFFKSRPIPYALKEKISIELDILVKVGILKPVRHAEWAALIVPVLKSDQTIQISPLYNLLKKQKWKWETPEERAFKDIKEKLVQSTLLVHFDPRKRKILSCDASGVGIGAVLSQVQRENGICISYTHSSGEKVLKTGPGSLRNCIWSDKPCQHATPNYTSQLASTNQPWNRVHIDHLGPFEQNLYLIVVDACTKWIEAIPVPNFSTSETIKQQCCLFTRFGIPSTLVSDNGTGTASFHPSSNGLAERERQTIQTGLKKVQQGSISQRLAEILLGYRRTPIASFGKSLYKMNFGDNIRSRLDFILPNPGKSEETGFKVEEFVWYRTYKSGPKWDQASIQGTTGNRLVTLQTAKGQVRRHWKTKYRDLSRIPGKRSESTDDHAGVSDDPDINTNTEPEELIPQRGASHSLLRTSPESLDYYTT